MCSGEDWMDPPVQEGRLGDFSYNYATVIFHNKPDATAACKTLNGAALLLRHQHASGRHERRRRQRRRRQRHARVRRNGGSRGFSGSATLEVRQGGRTRIVFTFAPPPLPLLPCFFYLDKCARGFRITIFFPGMCTFVRQNTTPFFITTQGTSTLRVFLDLTFFHMCWRPRQGKKNFCCVSGKFELLGR